MGVAKEEIASSRLSLDEEIDRFIFEEEGSPVSVPAQASDLEGETGDRSSVHALAIVITCLDSTSEEEMASNQKGKCLRKLLAGRSKGGTSKEAPKPKVPFSLPPSPPLPANLGLKANPELKKKMPILDLEEGEISQQKGSKQQKMAKDIQDKRVAITWDASVREYQRGQAAHIAEALEQPLLLPKDMEAMRKLKQQDLFLSLKRDLAMITQEVFVAEEWVKGARNEAKNKMLLRHDAERALRAAKAEKKELLSKLASEVKKQAFYQLGVEETQARLAKELTEACREFCNATWDEALYAAGVPTDSALRRSESVYYHPHIREVTDDPLSEAPDAVKAKEVEAKDVDSKVPNAAVEVKEMEAKAKDGESKAKDASTTQQSQKEDPPAPKA
ncbi:hypothetical protein SO802_009731 [Lithocarpus litseifolius]|uniref:Uncharacterized protein n=1 Tax=Lithocarpus litseifolius TaxID=425828 RepID=A0AAW2DF66_9ROSI